MPRHDEVAHADNWRRVLAVDAALGLVILVAGAVLAVARASEVGYLLALLGFLYIGFVVRRYRRWERLRLEAASRPRQE